LISVIKNADFLLGIELELIENGIIILNDQKIEKAGKASDVKNSESYLNAIKNDDAKFIDAEGFMIIPGLINSHTHIGDSIGKDISSNADLDTRVNPKHSIKKTILEKTDTSQLKQFMKNAAISMLNKGITTFIDFREGGSLGLNLLKDALKDVPIKSIALGRLDFNSFSGKYKNNDILKDNFRSMIESKPNQDWELDALKYGNDLLNECDGFGISGANEHDNFMLSVYKKIIRNTNVQNLPLKKNNSIVAIHAAESAQAVNESLRNSGMTEIERTISVLEPDVYVHVTNPTTHDLDLIHSANKGIVICPRANGMLGVGFAPIKEMMNRSLLISIGTDNVMINSPDIFKEMDFLLKSQRAYEKNNLFLDAKTILKMTTVNGGKMFNKNIGCVDVGYQADLLFIDKYGIDLYPLHDPYMSLVQRCSERDIKAIMIDGLFVHEKCNIN